MPQPTRDNFSAAAKRILAARAGHRCSNPACRVSTSGPQLDEERTLNLGVAAHISAAAGGGPRFDPTATTQLRSSGHNGIWLCQNCAKLVDNDVRRFTSELLNAWKQVAETTASNEIGRTVDTGTSTRQQAERNQESKIERRIQMKSTLEKALLRTPEERRKNSNHPYGKFRIGDVIIRSLDDCAYPNIDEKPGISSWFRLELFDFYHNGLEFILGILKGAINKDGRWQLLKFDDPLPEGAGWRQVKIWEIGQIPFDNIRAYDLRGDEYYNFPHLYCSFSNGGEPYEAVRHAIVGEGNEFDWPLESKDREDLTRAKGGAER